MPRSSGKGIARPRPAKLTQKQAELFRALTPAQQVFSERILEGDTQAKALIAAYIATGKPEPTDSTAKRTGFRWEHDAQIAAFLSACRTPDISLENRIARQIMTREEAAGILSHIARAKPAGQIKRIYDQESGEYVTAVVVDELTDDQREAIEELIPTRMGAVAKNYSKLNAIKQLAQLEGWEKQEKQETQIVINFTEKQARL